MYGWAVDSPNLPVLIIDKKSYKSTILVCFTLYCLVIKIFQIPYAMLIIPLFHIKCVFILYRCVFLTTST